MITDNENKGKRRKTKNKQKTQWHTKYSESEMGRLQEPG